MKICYDCGCQIHRREKWKITGCLVRHINCKNPRLQQRSLLLSQPSQGPAAPLDSQPPMLDTVKPESE
jgi:hypothetical protein